MGQDQQPFIGSEALASGSLGRCNELGALASHTFRPERRVDKNQLSRSMIMAMPWPPPTHIVSRPNRLVMGLQVVQAVWR